VLSTVFILGVCFGIVVAEKLYLSAQEGGTPVTTPESLRLEKATTNSAVSLADSIHRNQHQQHQEQDQKSLFIKDRQPRSELEKILQHVAPDGEVMIAISNMNLIREDSLVLWLKCVQRLGFPNWLVVAIDEELRDYCQKNGINHYYRPVVVRFMFVFFSFMLPAHYLVGLHPYWATLSRSPVSQGNIIKYNTLSFSLVVLCPPLFRKSHSAYDTHV